MHGRDYGTDPGMRQRLTDEVLPQVQERCLRQGRKPSQKTIQRCLSRRIERFLEETRDDGLRPLVADLEGELGITELRDAIAALEATKCSRTELLRLRKELEAKEKEKDERLPELQDQNDRELLFCLLNGDFDQAAFVDSVVADVLASTRRTGKQSR